MSRWLSLVVALTVSGSPCAALEIVFHERFVAAAVRNDAGTTYDSERHDATDLEVFQSTADASAYRDFFGNPIDPSIGCQYRCAGSSAQHDSIIGLADVTASGSSDANGIGSDIRGEAESRLEIAFALSSSTPYSIDGYVFNQYGSGRTVISLREDGNPSRPLVFSFGDANEDGWPAPFSTSGILTPGTYRLLASSFTCGGETFACNSSAGNGRTEFSFVLTVPEPAIGALLASGLVSLAAIRQRARCAS